MFALLSVDPYNIFMLLSRMEKMFGEVLTFALPDWLIELLPSSVPCSRSQLLKAAAVVGAARDIDAVRFGQVSVASPRRSCSLRFNEPKEVWLMENLSDKLHLSEPASIARTAVMLGFQIPGVEEGVISQTRFKPITYNEVGSLLYERQCILYGRKAVHQRTKSGFADLGQSSRGAGVARSTRKCVP